MKAPLAFSNVVPRVDQTIACESFLIEMETPSQRQALVLTHLVCLSRFEFAQADG